MQIWLPILVVCAIGLICGIGLSVASSVMAVKEDENFPKLRACLPGANCGACGFSGCDGYAKALCGEETRTNLCVPGGADTAKMLADVLGVAVQSTEKKFAVVRCSGSCDHTQQKEEYHGMTSCKAAKLIYGGPGSCIYGCIGFGDCQNACPEDAITVSRGVASIDKSLCKGCGLCAKACPQGIIALASGEKTMVFCRNLEKGAQARKNCTGGCIGCGKCVKNCEAGAITVVNNLAQIDHAKCTHCGKCAEVCTTGCIRIL